MTEHPPEGALIIPHAAMAMRCDGESSDGKDLVGFTDRCLFIIPTSDGRTTGDPEGVLAAQKPLVGKEEQLPLQRNIVHDACTVFPLVFCSQS